MCQYCKEQSINVQNVQLKKEIVFASKQFHLTQEIMMMWKEEVTLYSTHTYIYMHTAVSRQ